MRHRLFVTWIVCFVCLVLVWCDGARASSAPKSEPRSYSLHDYPAPDLTTDGFPVWLACDGSKARLAVVVEGVDLYNAIDAQGIMRMVSPIADRFREAGIGGLVVDFPDCHQAPEELAPFVARAVRAAASLSGEPVAVIGLSGGGLVARWALVAAEQSGEPLPVHTLFLIDTPNRGAHLNPALQALVMRYGSNADRDALTCPMARSLLREVPARVTWRAVGFPGARRRVPADVVTDGSCCAGFLERLTHLNGNRGYPQRCRVIALAQGSRRSPGADAKPRDLFRLWLPFGCGWTCRADAEDCAPGSLLPESTARRFERRLPLGIAGSRLRRLPAFVATDSALDAGPDETPPFQKWYSRAADAPPVAHDTAEPIAGAFLIRELTSGFATL